MADFAKTLIEGDNIRCIGAWTAQGVLGLSADLPDIEPSSDHLTLDASAISALDSSGAWVLQKLLQRLHQYGKTVAVTGLSRRHQSLLELVQSKQEEVNQSLPEQPNEHFLTLIGKQAVDKWQQGIKFIRFIGELATIAWLSFSRPQYIQWRAIAISIEEVGFRALPIIALLSFLIGIVLAYQMGLQLKLYGANVYIVNLTGIAILREFAPLITAIVVAGRTSSAFTAQLGSMKVNQEIDVLRTMGLSPANRLVLPKILGTVVALPLITVWAMLFGMLGAMVMAQSMLGINYMDFLMRFQTVVGASNYWIGLIKTPVFALIIAMVGCFQGFQVAANADSVGKYTTKSVVQAIFLIIIADALFSIIFSWQGM